MVIEWLPLLPGSIKGPWFESWVEACMFTLCPRGVFFPSHGPKTWKFRSTGGSKLPLDVSVRVNGVCVGLRAPPGCTVLPAWENGWMAGFFYNSQEVSKKQHLTEILQNNKKNNSTLYLQSFKSTNNSRNGIRDNVRLLPVLLNYTEIMRTPCWDGGWWAGTALK